MKIVLIDNYDSFTHILGQYFREQDGVDLTILKNDAFLIRDLENYDCIVISPGPGLPQSNGQIIEVIQVYSGRKPILGICLGLQAIYEAFGGKLYNLPTVHHGVTSDVHHTDQEDFLFNGIPDPFKAGRYHSWVCDPAHLPDALQIIALDTEGIIMACRHVSHITYGVQFHPESILTPEGKKMIQNFVNLNRS
jgi:anthranilate synthase component II